MRSRSARSTSTSPSTARSCSSEMPPGRSRRGRAPHSETTVDSTPTVHAPPSTTAAILPFKSSMTCCAVVVEGRPDRFAEGAASGTPAARMIACASGCDGNRIPTVFNPPDVTIGIESCLGRMIVSGPGQYAFASACAAGGKSAAMSCTVSRCAMCTMSGLSCGRPFASKIRATASGLRASAARPYTVSVGMPTTSPARSSSPACSIAVGSSDGRSSFVCMNLPLLITYSIYVFLIYYL